MKIVNTFIIVALVIMGCSCYFFKQAPELNWDNLISFKMYAFNYAKPLSHLKDAEMDTLVSIDIPVAEARKMFKGRIRPTNDILIYKTMILCRLKFKGGPDRRFVISSYGSFFTDLHANQLYKVSSEHITEWRKFISGYERKLLDKNYLKYYPKEDTTNWYHPVTN